MSRPRRFAFGDLPAGVHAEIAARMPALNAASLAAASRNTRAAMSDHLDSLRPQRRAIGEAYARLEEAVLAAADAGQMLASGSWSKAGVIRMHPEFTMTPARALELWSPPSDAADPYSYSHDIIIDTPYHPRKWVLWTTFGRADRMWDIYTGFIGRDLADRVVNVYVTPGGPRGNGDLRARKAMTELFARLFRKSGYRVVTGTPNWVIGAGGPARPAMGVMGPELL